MSLDKEQFYITGIYFKENITSNQFCRFHRWIQSVNRKNRAVSPDKISYAMLEVFAEYKRKGISAAELIKCLLSFNPVFLLRESVERKKRLQADGYKCIEAAGKIGLKQIGGTLACPVFSK